MSKDSSSRLWLSRVGAKATERGQSADKPQERRKHVFKITHNRKQFSVVHRHPGYHAAIAQKIFDASLTEHCVDPGSTGRMCPREASSRGNQLSWIIRELGYMTEESQEREGRGECKGKLVEKRNEDRKHCSTGL